MRQVWDWTVLGVLGKQSCGRIWGWPGLYTPCTREGGDFVESLLLVLHRCAPAGEAGECAERPVFWAM